MSFIRLLNIVIVKKMFRPSRPYWLAGRTRIIVVMKRIGIVAAATIAILAAAFVIIGGNQLVIILAGPRLPRQTAPTPAGDLEYLREAVERNERGLTIQQLNGFQRLIASAESASTLGDEEASVAALRAMAVLENAHSTVLDPRLRRLPIRVHWFGDGLFIIKARPAWAQLLGRRIVAIGGEPPERLVSNLSTLVSGNDSWLRYRSEYFLVAPAAIRSLGGIATTSVEIALEDAAGGRTSSTLESDANVLPGDAFWEWEHQLPGDTSFGTQGWQTVLSSTQPLPLYLDTPQALHVLRDLPSDNALYIRLDGSIDDAAEPLGTFLDKCLETERTQRRRNVVVDFRFNWGGGYDKTARFTRVLPALIPDDGRLFLITGPNTFSAGLLAAARLKYFAKQRLTIIGEPVGDDLEFRAEGFLVTLPSTGMKVYLSTARHDVRHGCGWFDNCFILDKFIGVSTPTLAPDILVKNASLSYANGRDDVLEEVLRRISARH